MKEGFRVVEKLHPAVAEKIDIFTHLTEFMGISVLLQVFF